MNIDDAISDVKKTGKDPEIVQKQLERFKIGFPYVTLVEPTTIRKGITSNVEDKADLYLSLFERANNEFSISKFVPASGAATRMFKALNESLLNGELNPSTKWFLSNIEKIPFYIDLNELLLMQEGKDVVQLLKDNHWKVVLEYILFQKGLKFQTMPKALIKFHKENITPLEDHVIEAVNTRIKRLHFTITEDFESEFLDMFKDLSRLYNVDISYSYQLQSTDTVAVNIDDTPLIENQQLVFRPAGHGALLMNLNKLKNDIIYIRNIDNVSTKYKEVNVRYSKLLIGVLYELRQNLLQYYISIKEGNTISIKKCIDYINESCGISLSYQMEREELLAMLNSPIRVCGMVKNLGEPGGGPFFTTNNLFPQIVEKSQIDINDQDQRSILEGSSHFNPVDIACFVKDMEGNEIDLLDYVDQNTGFITDKTYKGKKIKAMELPGLWNGSMAKWITLFVEIPLEAFNPVKEVNDLLKESHQ